MFRAVSWSVASTIVICSASTGQKLKMSGDQLMLHAPTVPPSATTVLTTRARAADRVQRTKNHCENVATQRRTRDATDLAPPEGGYRDYTAESIRHSVANASQSLCAACRSRRLGQPKSIRREEFSLQGATFVTSVNNASTRHINASHPGAGINGAARDRASRSICGPALGVPSCV